jgi:microcystin-dependent protein
MASYAFTFASGDTVTPQRLNDARTISAIVNADIDAAAAISGSKIANDSIAVAKLVTAVQDAFVPAGAVQAFAMNSAPSGWLAADGSAVSRTTYAALFSAIGTTYGSGDGSTTFAVPDLRGYFVRGSGTNSDGTAAGTFGAKQADDFKAHTHTTGQGIVGAVGAAAFAGGPFAITTATGSTGGTETRPKNIAMLYCIKT